MSVEINQEEKVSFGGSTIQYITASIFIGCILLLLIFIDGDSQLYIILRTIFGGISLLFLPGYWLTRVFFEENEIDILERVSLSFALSISIIPLCVFYLNLVGIPISAYMVRGVVMVVLFACWGILRRKGALR